MLVKMNVLESRDGFKPFYFESFYGFRLFFWPPLSIIELLGG